jgi:phage/plasmid-like protein (TIGR03299 family)
MSQENFGWLAKYVLAGFVQTREPWWLRLAIREGHEPHTFDGPVPMPEVEKLLCSWQPVAANLLDEDAVLEVLAANDGGRVTREQLRAALVASHKLIKASDDKSQLGLVGSDSATHTYAEWLVGTVKECVRPDELEVSSAGLLRNRSQAWIQIERPQTAVGPDGILFSPYVTLSTSLDASLASQINQNTQMTICDNTLNVTRGQGVAFKHTSRSQSRLGTFRGVMTAIMQGESDFKEVLEKLLAEEVPDRRFRNFLEAFVPIADDDTPAKRTRSERKRQDITQLYRSDPRVQSWKGTAFGVVQAVNTYEQHLSQLRNGTGIELSDTDLRAMRNYSQRLAPAKGETSDEATMRVLAGVA